MDSVIQALVERGGGLVTRDDVLRCRPRSTLESACRSGRLLRLLPGVYVDAALVDNPQRTSPAARAGSAVDTAPLTRAIVPPLARIAPALARRAALAYADGRGALSHLTALDVWGLRRQPAGEPLHIDVPITSGLRNRPHLLVHHRRRFAPQPPHALVRNGAPVTRLDRSLVVAWPLLPVVERAGTVIRAVNDRLTTPERIGTALEGVPRLADRATLRGLLDRLAAGCRSPLEIWGHDRVFTGPGMPAFLRQARVQVGGRVVYLDLYAEAEEVNIELDGATTHGDPREREIDLRRDALLATRGILVVRFTHRRLLHHPDDVRRETLAILATRRRAPMIS
ncbi:DUF559 domain-containing protein [Micromonospora sp. NPDC049460]|uniref:DUF559 domain-containing protein n=1 Tax=Micromonospora sp. NPDC049460 TaxID=3364272 RepID=UPI0037977360